MVQTYDYTEFIQLHEIQLKSSNIPEWYWRMLHIKLENQVFDSNETFALLKIDYDGETRTAEDPLWIVQIKSEQGLKHDDEKHIYLVDHAWTFRTNQARQQLSQMPQLLDRICNIIGVDNTEHTVASIDQVCTLMWKYCHTYSIGNAENVEDRLPIWYIMDELGCGIRHSDEPNFRAVPFFHIPEQITYTLIFPIKDVDYEEIVTRDFIEGATDILQRKAQLIPWIKSDLTDVNYNQNEPDEDYFLSGHLRETLPPTDLDIKMPEYKIKVYSEYSMINKFLTDERFELTNDENNADILWYTKHFKTYSELSETPYKFVNQFPFENILTIKDLLSIVCRRKIKSNIPDWYPTTYNLKTELLQFISYFQHREKQGLDNLWICKPWNLARSLDIHITNNLDYIVRLPVTGPKIAQKYIENPVLFHRPELGKVKFDVRYVILLKSTSPLKAYIYNNFFLRFSNKPFELSDFDDYEKHFTVMNYSEETQLHHLPCADFLRQWEQQYPGFTWLEIEKLIIKMLREVFEGAVSLPPPRGIPSSPQSRAVYAADIILSWDSPDRMQPKLLEINWTPDCKRACDYYPDFYNNIFSCLFLNVENTNSFTSL